MSGLGIYTLNRPLSSVEGEYKTEYDKLMSNDKLTYRFKRTLEELDRVEVLSALYEAELLVEILQLKWDIEKDAKACGEVA